ncbi:hypothetical protein HK097_007954 [Rhizophlyctis rosea]|uniref:Protein-tyrosine-phosphatase n=1 Tax=Rhizophlyctis rosea TaxID=64517 RepID=A0AAD5X484_9FUNG|nr:hypothetical protein HK097_007954 [Rhizophlyctis rosea]
MSNVKTTEDAHAYVKYLDTYLPSIKPPSLILKSSTGGKLLLGGIDVLKSGHATAYDHIISITNQSQLDYALHSSILLNTAQKRDFHWAADDVFFDISQYFDTVAEAIEDSLKEGKTVYVHCFMGKSRSAACVVAYLIEFRGMSFFEAVDFVGCKRHAVCINSGFGVQLQKYAERVKLEGAKCEGKMHECEEEAVGKDNVKQTVNALAEEVGR